MFIQKKRNAFFALAVLANRERWCWNLGCTTCGRHTFRHGLSEIARGMHPDSSQWELTETGDMPERFEAPAPQFSAPQQGVIAGIVSQVDLNELVEHCRYPDWLGFIGFVLEQTPDAETETGLLTASLVPQLIEQVDEPAERERLDRMFSDGRMLCWEDLEWFQESMRSNH